MRHPPAGGLLPRDDDKVRIAILERGGGGRDSNDDGDVDGDVDGRKETRCSRFYHPHPSMMCLSRWFEASHYSSTITDVAMEEVIDRVANGAACYGPESIHELSCHGRAHRTGMGRIHERPRRSDHGADLFDVVNVWWCGHVSGGGYC